MIDHLLAGERRTRGPSMFWLRSPEVGGLGANSAERCVSALTFLRRLKWLSS
jgi:hypothetical protein